MADTKISALTAVTDVLATDEYVLARSGVSNKIDASDMLPIRKIEKQTLGSTGFIDFQSIPATFSHLRIVASIRSAQANNEEGLRVRFNNDTSTNGYGGYGSNLNVSHSAVADAGGGAYVQVGTIIGNSGTANRFAAVTIDLPDYADTGKHKSVLCSFAYAFSTTAASLRQGTGGGHWPVTTAIDRILLWTGSGAGQLLTGSSATLYGIA